MQTNTNNLIKNIDFADTLKNWFLLLESGGKANMNVKNQILSIQVFNEGKWPWSVQLMQDNLYLEKNVVYEFSIIVRSADIKQISVVIQMIQQPYHPYSGRHEFIISNEFQKFTFLFTMRETTTRSAALYLLLGRLNCGKIDIKDIRLIRKDSAALDTVDKNFPQPFSEKPLRGINLGNIFEAPFEGAWGPECREEYFDLIKETGIFDFIRIPVRWDTHADNKSPYTIHPDFFKRIEWAVCQGLKRGFYVVLNIHYFDEFAVNPLIKFSQFKALWRQIAEYFHDYPDNLFFEIYNEPRIILSFFWNWCFPGAYDVIRHTNPDRTVIISCQNWAQITSLRYLALPKRIKTDPNVRIQFHFYNPLNFCFQGSIGNGFESVKGVRWTGSRKERNKLIRLADQAVKWAEKNSNIRLWNGEFSVQRVFAEEEDRRIWTRLIIELCEERDIPWAYWDFASDTSRIYNPDMNVWDEPILQIMQQQKKKMENNDADN